MEEKEKNIENESEYFGPLYPYVLDEDITDVDYNGKELWLTNSRNNRYLCEDTVLDDAFVEQFTKRVANTVSRPFHKQNPVLEAETDTLRITIVHESVAISGRSFCIRKSLPKVRLSEKEMLSSGYCSREIHDFLKNCIKIRCCMTFTGEPGAGKTECAKYFSGFIPVNDRVITIEDTPEWHYAEVNPDHDCIELKVGETMDYTAAIKTCLRLNPKWMFLSEVRSKEVMYLIEGFSTGVKGITTLHTDDVRKVPDRMLNMAGRDGSGSRMENDIYMFLDIAVMIRRKERRLPGGRKEVKRFIDQVGLFYREGKDNKFLMIADDGEVLTKELPDEYKKRFAEAGIEDPFSCDNNKSSSVIDSPSELFSPMIKNEVTISEDESLRKFREESVRAIMAEVERGTYLGKKKSVGRA